MGFAAAFALQLAIGAVVGLLIAGPVVRRRLGLLLGLPSLAVPLLLPSDAPLSRFVIGLGAVLIVLRSIDLVRDRRGLPPARRIWHVLAIFDTRRAQTRPRGFDARLLAAALTWALLSALVFYLGTFVANTVEGPAHYALRWGGCAAFAIASWEALTRSVVVLYGMVGVRPPPLHEAPYLSRSIREFWGVRWNKVVGTWLRLNCHHPLARAGRPRAAVAAAFAASALLHWYLVAVALGLGWSLVMAAFFLLQILLIGVEDGLRVRGWNQGVAHLWTVAVLALSSPLFCEPMLRMVDPWVRPLGVGPLAGGG